MLRLGLLCHVHILEVVTFQYYIAHAKDNWKLENSTQHGLQSVNVLPWVVWKQVMSYVYPRMKDNYKCSALEKCGFFLWIPFFFLKILSENKIKDNNKIRIHFPVSRRCCDSPRCPGSLTLFHVSIIRCTNRLLRIKITLRLWCI